MNYMKPLFLGLLASMLGGCAAVYSPAPVGESRVALEEKDWEGQWIHAEGFATIEVSDTADGLLEVLWVEQSEARQLNIHVLDSGEWTFASFIDPDEEAAEPTGAPGPAAPQYLWFRIENEVGYLILWAPHAGKFRELVNEGKLPGHVPEAPEFGLADVILGELSAEHYRLITGSEDGRLLHWEHPYVLMRIRD